MQRCKVLALVPYSGLAEIINQVKGDYGELSFKVAVTDVQHTEDIDLLLKQENFDMIASRGGLLNYVRDKVDVPCFEFEISAFDILRTAKLLETFSKMKPIIIGKMDCEQYADIIEEAYGITIPVRTVDDFADEEEAVAWAVREGYSLIVGDNIVWRAGKTIGVPTILLASGEESVRRACDAMVKMGKYISREKERTAIYKYMLANPGGLWKIEDMKGREYYNNFLDDHKDVLEKIRNLTLKSELKNGKGGFWMEGVFWRVLSEEKMLEDFGPFRIIHAYENLELNADLASVLRIDKSGFTRNSASVMMISQNEKSRRVAQEVKAFAETDLSVYISGEEGVGKNGIALEIHKRSKWKDSLFIQVNCEELTASSIHQLFDGETGKISQLNKGTLYFADFESMNKECQKLVLRFFSLKRNRSRFRILAGSCYSIQEILARDLTTRRFLDLIGELELKIPRLAEQKENIITIAGMHLFDFNRKYGWKVSSMEKSGRKLIENYDWPGNINQLDYVLKKALINVKNNPNITEIKTEWLKAALEESIPIWGKPVQEISFEGTLEEIEKKIIEKVLKDNEMNQTKAAKQLGISRSTLYRKLTESEN